MSNATPGTDDRDHQASGATPPLAARIASGHVRHGPCLPVVTLIERQAAATPDRPAVICQAPNETVLTYAEFDALAGGLAARLRRSGVRPGDMLPLLIGNSIELPLGMVAAMKLGAVFVPCDPAWPEERLRGVLAALSPPVVLTGGTPTPPGHRALVVSAGDLPRQPDGHGLAPGADWPAYGVFTSGSTGTPKCAINLHGGLTNRFSFMSRYFPATGDEVVLQNSRHTFDSAIWQLLWPLTTGGRTVIPEQGEFLDLERTVATIARHRVTITDFVPAILALLVSLLESDASAAAQLTSLRHVVVGGEEIIPRAVHRLRELVPGLEVSNGYGPSEASIGMIFHRVSRTEGDAIPLGHPIDNCHAVITDASLRPLPAGRTGEIVIGGACLGAGYLGDPGRTAEVFVPNPFPEIPGERLYRTGDLGWLGEDGLLRFAGRRDRQVKVDGVRIELGEIETAAEGCPGVVQAKAITLLREGRTRLVVIAASNASTTPEGLRRHLAARLPRLQLPHHCLVLPDLPLTENGKVDVPQLRAIAAGKLGRQPGKGTGTEPVPENGQAHRGPGDAGATATRLARVLGESLGVPGFGTGDDFLLRGGDSLSALRAALAIREELGLRISVSDIYALRTPDALATRTRTPPEALDRDAAPPPGIAERARRAARHRPAAPNPSGPGTVLVTGGNGFVGARVVHRLLAATPARVVCLVRADDDLLARERLVQALCAQGPYSAAMNARLDVRHGDLTRARFGWPGDQWSAYAASCDAVLHLGARVSFVLDYRAHRQANVLGTAEVLRFCLSGRLKPLHHVSTLGVLDHQALRSGTPLGEDFLPERAGPPPGGYSRSKWVAERMVLAAGRLGAPVTVYRLGEVMPAADNGLPNPQALTHLLLSAFHRLGVRPEVPMRSDYTPVDEAAARLVAGLAEPSDGRVFHVFRPGSIDFAALDLAGPGRHAPLPVPPGQFTARLRDAARDDPRSAEGVLHMLLMALPPTGHDGGPDFRRLLADNPALFTREACAALDARHGIQEIDLATALAAYRRTLGAGETVAGRD